MTVIATRQLSVIGKSGDKLPVALRLESPVLEDGIWRCWYEIDWPEDGWPAQTTRAWAGGKDSLHAIQMGLMKLSVDLHFSSYHHSEKMQWVDGWIGYGLIIAKDARDMLRGDDATYYG